MFMGNQDDVRRIFPANGERVGIDRFFSGYLECVMPQPVDVSRHFFAPFMPAEADESKEKSSNRVTNIKKNRATDDPLGFFCRNEPLRLPDGGKGWNACDVPVGWT
jgi:hypothetical protein